MLDARNAPIEQPTSFDVNTSIQRCLVKAIALHGLGLSVYAGEDLPKPAAKSPRTADKPKAPVTAHPTASPATPAQIRYIERLIKETGGELSKVLDYFRVTSLPELSAHAASRAITSLEKNRRAA